MREVTKGRDSGSSKRKGRGRNLRGKGWGMLNISLHSGQTSEICKS